MRTRIITVLVLLPIVLLFLYLGGIPWLIGILLVGVLGWREMTALLQRDQFTVDHALGYFFVIGAIVEAYLQSSGLLSVDLLRPLLASLIMFSLIWALFLRSEHPTADWGMTVASALYLGFLLSTFVSLRVRSNGLEWLITAFAITWMIDASAFFAGRLFGRHKWWPRLSPKKTWEGLIGGSIVGLLTAILLGVWLLGLNPWLGLLLGVLSRDLRTDGRPGCLALQAQGRSQRYRPAHSRPRRHPRPAGQPALHRPARHLFRHVRRRPLNPVLHI